MACEEQGLDTFFSGKERDTKSGLDFGERYYASNMGRWMSPDWADKPEAVPYSSLDNPQSLNLYGYVLNNPLSKADPDGHCPQCLVWAAQAFEEVESTPAGQMVNRAVATAGALAAGFIATHVDSFAGGSGIAGVPNSVNGQYTPANVLNANGQAPAVDQPAPSRTGALNEAKNDAGVPTSQQGKQESVPVTDSNGKQVVVNGQPQTSRESTHTTGDGKTVVIQDHGQGHTFPDGAR